MFNIVFNISSYYEDFDKVAESVECLPDCGMHYIRVARHLVIRLEMLGLKSLRPVSADKYVDLIPFAEIDRQWSTIN